MIVRENAGGISEEIIEKIFDSYFSTTLEKDGTGTGLGLYIFKTIIDEHCGVSNDTHGALFRVSL